ncbi:5-bromo-4-chloroindolyl phosphate hydrolysis protein [Alloiococcus otitis]|uniref:5-bromo-4-chloroindolyl phosphate hydrolysis protein n=1 Tax=Alloiococcus otitis ATCC 51267 TaxID=883081 RepID=K9EZ00_9LACT|nr:5-bromo-4-chloroindolyl phosphate hydrolysis family protein [Alloiococcus otitis]EKU94395.1 hypothetical protein HMPREF9698_00123 [Alloiococcus otitis ATCC 51267]SUU81275.1 5-bromo-4-chloroindolyl phosphate hydrolysis protein [Alloiococcus otitis]
MTRSQKFLSYFLTGLAFSLVLGAALDDEFNSLLALIIAVLAACGAYFLIKKSFQKDSQSPQVPKLSKDKENFYRSKGLSSDDIKFFRQTMQTSKKHILAIEKQIKSSSKLSAIEKRHNTIEITKSLFKDIVIEPDRLHQVDQFLYIHLPSLDDMTRKFVKIEGHTAKSKATFDILTKSSETIEDLCQEITQDYLDFRQADLSSIQASIDITEDSLDDHDQTFQNWKSIHDTEI